MASCLGRAQKLVRVDTWSSTWLRGGIWSVPFADTLGRLRCHLKFHPNNEIQAGVASPGPPFIKKRGEADPQGFFTYIPLVKT